MLYGGFVYSTKQRCQIKLTKELTIEQIVTGLQKICEVISYCIYKVAETANDVPAIHSSSIQMLSDIPIYGSLSSQQGLDVLLLGEVKWI
jgi:hypothetical protein